MLSRYIWCLFLDTHDVSKHFFEGDYLLASQLAPPFDGAFQAAGRIHSRLSFPTITSPESWYEDSTRPVKFFFSCGKFGIQCTFQHPTIIWKQVLQTYFWICKKKGHDVIPKKGGTSSFSVSQKNASFIAQDGLISVFFPGSNSPLQRHVMKFLTATTHEAHQNGKRNLWNSWKIKTACFLGLDTSGVPKIAGLRLHYCEPIKFVTVKRWQLMDITVSVFFSRITSMGLC